MRYLVVIPVEADGPEELARSLKTADLSDIPGFGGQIMLAINDVAEEIDSIFSREEKSNTNGKI